MPPSAGRRCCAAARATLSTAHKARLWWRQNIKTINLLETSGEAASLGVYSKSTSVGRGKIYLRSDIFHNQMSSGLKVNTPVVINSKRIQISRKVIFSNHCLDSRDSGHRFAGKRHPWKTKLDIVFKLVKVSRYSKDCFWYDFTFTAGFSLNEVK